MAIHETSKNDDESADSLHFIVEQIHSSINVSKNKTSKVQKHIVLEPFNVFMCNNSNTKQNKDNRKSKAKQGTRKLSPKGPYVNVIVDSGATRHCCNNLDIMSNIKNTNVNIMVGNGNIIHATKMGDIGCIKDVLYLPEIKHFLFSISYMLHTCPKCRVEFFNHGFQLKVGRKIIGRGVLADSNLYVLRVRLPKFYNDIGKNNLDKSLFIDLEKSNIPIKQLKKLQENLPVQFEYI